MKTIVETPWEIVEIINGVLSCKNTKQNWSTISEWMQYEENNKEFSASINVRRGRIFIEFPDSTPAHKLGSLLEAFEYQ